MPRLGRHTFRLCCLRTCLNWQLPPIFTAVMPGVRRKTCCPSAGYAYRSLQVCLSTAIETNVPRSHAPTEHVQPEQVTKIRKILHLNKLIMSSLVTPSLCTGRTYGHHASSWNSFLRYVVSTATAGISAEWRSLPGLTPLPPFTSPVPAHPRRLQRPHLAPQMAVSRCVLVESSRSEGLTHDSSRHSATNDLRDAANGTARNRLSRSDQRCPE